MREAVMKYDETLRGGRCYNGYVCYIQGGGA